MPARWTRNRRKAAGSHVTDRAAVTVDEAVTEITGDDRDVVGPSPNPATNLLIHDVLLRAGTRLLRNSLEKGLLSNRYGHESAKEMIDNRSARAALATFLVSRLATRSLPGAAVVGAGLIGKTLFDRSQRRRKARRAGDRQLRKQQRRGSAD